MSRLRKKLVKLLAEIDIHVKVEDFWVSLGWWRTSCFSGTARWGVIGKCHSFDTMTSCCKYGIDIVASPRWEIEAEICSRQTSEERRRELAHQEEKNRKRFDRISKLQKENQQRRRDNFRIYRCECGLQFPGDLTTTNCMTCDQQTLNDVTDSVLGF